VLIACVYATGANTQRSICGHGFPLLLHTYRLVHCCVSISPFHKDTQMQLKYTKIKFKPKCPWPFSHERRALHHDHCGSSRQGRHAQRHHPDERYVRSSLTSGIPNLIWVPVAQLLGHQRRYGALAEARPKLQTLCVRTPEGPPQSLPMPAGSVFGGTEFHPGVSLVPLDR